MAFRYLEVELNVSVTLADYCQKETTWSLSQNENKKRNKRSTISTFWNSNNRSIKFWVISYAYMYTLSVKRSITFIPWEIFDNIWKANIRSRLCLMLEWPFFLPVLFMFLEWVLKVKPCLFHTFLPFKIFWYYFVGTYTVCIYYMTGENPVPWLDQFVNIFSYLKTGLNWPAG